MIFFNIWWITYVINDEYDSITVFGILCNENHSQSHTQPLPSGTFLRNRWRYLAWEGKCGLFLVKKSNPPGLERAIPLLKYFRCFHRNSPYLKKAVTQTILFSGTLILCPHLSSHFDATRFPTMRNKASHYRRSVHRHIRRSSHYQAIKYLATQHQTFTPSYGHRLGDF